MTIGDRIKNRRSELGLSADDLAEKLGKSRATIYRYENGEIEKLPTTVLEPLAVALNTTPAYLMGWEEDEKTPPKPEGITFLDSKNIRMIPLYESVSAGFGAYADSMRIGYVPMYIETEYDAENMLAIKVKGDSMYPKIEDGDTVVVRKQEDFENGDIAVILVDGDEGYVKKIIQSENQITLVSINPEYQDKIYAGSEIERLRVVGVVKKVIKEM